MNNGSKIKNSKEVEKEVCPLCGSEIFYLLEVVGKKVTFYSKYCSITGYNNKSFGRPKNKFACGSCDCRFSEPKTIYKKGER